MRLPELVEHTRSFFRQTYNTIVDRVCLHRHLQQTGETVHLYLDALKRIAANCCFAPAEYHSRVRDIFVAGLRNDEMLQKFYERDNLLTTPLEQVLAFARMLESAMDSVAATQDTSASVNLETIQNIRKTRHQPRQAKEDRVYVRDTNENDQQRRVGACYICGDRKHYQLVCSLRKHRDLLFCSNCKNSGHVELACRSKTPDRQIVETGKNKSKAYCFDQAV